MPFEKGNKLREGQVSNPNGRKTLAEEIKMGNWLKEVFENDTDIEVIKDKIKSGKYSPKTMMVLKLLTGNDKLLTATLNKLAPDLHEIKGSFTGSLSMTTEEIDEVKKMFPDA
jgi:hypothetical protein